MKISTTKEMVCVAFSQTTDDARLAAEAVDVELRKVGLPTHGVEGGVGGESVCSEQSCRKSHFHIFIF